MQPCRCFTKKKKKTVAGDKITNLSGFVGNSVNDHIDPALCSVLYDSFDHAISIIQTFGTGALLCKMDLSNAFRLLPIHPSDFCLLGMRIDDKYYIDKCMPFGCSLACSTFEKLSSFLHWLIAKGPIIQTLFIIWMISCLQASAIPLPVLICLVYFS
jgi:hypothetical protein